MCDRSEAKNFVAMAFRLGLESDRAFAVLVKMLGNGVSAEWAIYSYNHLAIRRERVAESLISKASLMDSVERQRKIIFLHRCYKAA